ncbi:MAG: fumarylacetoacetate hydrolase family protein [Desulfobacteraceae bacterium]|nr:fumarylacetoacetate hydrolase family protein [Desulfobacteraceae bacterium]
MKFIRFGEPGYEKPGLWQTDGIVDLQLHFPSIPDIGVNFFKVGWIDRLKEFSASGKPGKVRLGPPVANPAKILCIGKNYSEHAREGGFDIPERPLVFCKTPNALTGPFDPVLMPVSFGQVDWEVELAVIIGREGKRIPKSEAMTYVAGFSVMNDVSARQAQFSESQWFRGKSFDTFAPLGPYLVTADEIGDLYDLRLTSKVNGNLMQEANTRDMLFDVAALIEDISQDITLTPGDIISTGTPSGVGIFRDPPVLLKAGDDVECAIEKVGTIRNGFI